MNRKHAVVALAVLLSLVSSGCWTKGELSELAIVLGTGIDWTNEGNIRLTVQIAKPAGFTAEGGRKTTEPPVWVVSAEGKSIEEAIRLLSMRVPRRVYWGHCVILVIGEDMARVGIDMVLNFFFRSIEPQENMWMMVARGKAEDVLKAASSLEKGSALAAGFLFKERIGLVVQLREYEEMLTSDGQQPTLPIIRVSPMDSASAELELSETAVFKEDRMIGWLDDSETRGLMWLKGEVGRRMIITVPSPGEPEKMVSAEVMSANVNTASAYEGGKPRFVVTVKAVCDLCEQQSLEDVTTQDKIAALEREMAADIEQKAASALEKAQREYGVDIFGFGDAFHRQHKKEWRELKHNWDEEFREAEVQIQAQVRIKTVGLMLASPKVQHLEASK